MAANRVFAAVDLGASSGRVVAGLVADGRTTLQEIHRFPNRATMRHGHLRWDIEGLFAEVANGLGRLASEHPQVESIGIDTWGVDYGLLDADGALLADPISHRDDRTTSAVARVHERVGPDELYAINGLQFLPFTTLYQLEAEKDGPLWEQVAHVVLVPDLLAHWLTGELRTEVTNASTTGLLDARTGRWSEELLDRVDLPAERLPALQAPGEVRGPIRPERRRELGLPSTTVVTTVGSHDTASAVVALPASDASFAYVISGTWSLVGLDLPRPVMTEAARVHNFANETGIDRRTRFLRNVGGLWLLQESMRAWAEAGRPMALADLLADAAARPDGGPIIDVDDQAFIAPGAMPDRIAAAVAANGEPPPETPADVARCVIESLAHSYATTVDQAARLAGHPVSAVHVVGGGARNELLCQRTADLTGRPVTAGPVEATALGNVLVQARAHGAVAPDLASLRATIAGGDDVRRVSPRVDLGDRS